MGGPPIPAALLVIPVKAPIKNERKTLLFPLYIQPLNKNNAEIIMKPDIMRRSVSGLVIIRNQTPNGVARKLPTASGITKPHSAF